jgi:hypothetical protein
MNLRHLIPILPQLLNQLRSIQLAVTTSSLDDLGLLLKSEVLPCEGGADVFFEQRQYFVVGNGTRVGEIVDASFLVLGHKDGSWQEIVQDGVGVGDVDYALVFGDLGDEITGVKVVTDGHA